MNNNEDKIAIGYSCYQSVKEIDRSLRPWLPHVDYIVAIDGRYKTPESPEMKLMTLPDYSTDGTEEELKRVCGGNDKLVYERFFGSQMEKRQRYLDIAGELGCEYLIVFDSDDFLHPDHQDWNKFYQQLELTKHWNDQIFKMLCWIPDTKLWARQHNAVPSEYWMKYSRVHRNPGNQRYVLNHYSFTTKDITDDQINEWDCNHTAEPGFAPLENPLLLDSNIVLDGVRFTTDRKFRTADQLTFGDGWAWQNLNEENWRHVIIPTVKRQGVRIPYENEEYYFNEKAERIAYLKKGKTAITPLVIKDGQIINS